MGKALIAGGAACFLLLVILSLLHTGEWAFKPFGLAGIVLFFAGLIALR